MLEIGELIFMGKITSTYFLLDIFPSIPFSLFSLLSPNPIHMDHWVSLYSLGFLLLNPSFAFVLYLLAYNEYFILRLTIHAFTHRWTLS